MSSVETMSAEEVADLLKVTQPTVYRWAKEGVLPSKRLGRTLRFSRTDVEKMVQDGDGSRPEPTDDELVNLIADRIVEELKRRGYFK